MKKPAVGQDSRWGEIEEVSEVIEGHAYEVTTASHGGLIISNMLDSKIPREQRGDSKYPTSYEEDCEWAIPCYFVPGLLEALAVSVNYGLEVPGEDFEALKDAMIGTIKHYYPIILKYYPTSKGTAHASHLDEVFTTDRTPTAQN